MSLIQVRKIQTVVEEVFHEGGPPPAVPLRQGAIAAVLRNPYAGRYVEDILPLMEALMPLGVDLARRLIAALGGDIAAIQGYGKGAIVGAGGELEHGALWHMPGGHGMREALAGGKAIVPSTKKLGAPGTRLDVPVTHLDASYVRSHYSAVEVGVADAPRADELVVILVMTTGPRVHARVGGLQAAEIEGKDGLR